MRRHHQLRRANHTGKPALAIGLGAGRIPPPDAAAVFVPSVLYMPPNRLPNAQEANNERQRQLPKTALRTVCTHRLPRVSHANLPAIRTKQAGRMMSVRVWR